LVCLIELIFAFSCLKFVRRLRIIYGTGAKNLPFIKSLGIICILASIFNTAYQIFAVVTPNDLEKRANSGTYFSDVLLWTIINNGLNLVCNYIPMLFSLFVFRPVNISIADMETSRSLAKAPLLSVKSTFVGSLISDSPRMSMIDNWFTRKKKKMNDWNRLFLNNDEY